MVESRLDREVGTRDATKRAQAWTPPSTLPSPAPQEGWAFRWIRTAAMGQSDPTNVSAKFREGWVPCKAEDHPEMQVFRDPNVNNRFKDNIEVGGLLLCKAPIEMIKQRDEYYRNAAESQVQAVDNTYMKLQADPRMPLFNEKQRTKVSFGKGS